MLGLGNAFKYWDVDKRERWWREGYSEGGKLFSPSLSTPASKAGLVSRLLEERMEENEGGGSRERALPVFHLTCRVRQGVKRRGKKTSLPEVGVASHCVLCRGLQSHPILISKFQFLRRGAD